jgi:putative PEP-CTERM system TPR-repeat lipoprotein
MLSILTRVGEIRVQEIRGSIQEGCLFIATVMLCTWPLMSLAMDAEDYLREAGTYLEQGQDGHAVIQLKNALLEDQDNTDARLLLGEVYLDQGDIRSAEKELRRARELGAGRERVILPLGRTWLLMGESARVLEEIIVEEGDSIPLQAGILSLHGKVYLIKQEPAKADEEFTRALELEPSAVDALLGKATVAKLQGDNEDYVALVDKALVIDPKSADAWAMKGSQLRLDGKLQEAVSAYDKVLQVEPGRTNARIAKAMALMGLGQFAEAQKEVDQIKEKDRDYYLVHYTRALLFFEQRELQQAQDFLQRTLKRVPGFMPAHLLAGIVYYQQGQFNQAEQHLAKYREAVPGNQQADTLHAAIFMKLNEPGKAVEILAPGLSSAKDDAQYLALLGGAYMANGESDKGLEYLQHATDIAPDAAAIRAQLAIGMMAQGNTEEGIVQLQQVVDLGQDLLQAEVMLIMGYLQQQDFEKAVEAADKLAKKMPDNPVPHNLKGVALLQHKDRVEARASFENAIRLNPKFIHAYLNLAQLDLSEDDITAAKMQYLKVLKYDAGNPKALFALATLAEREGRSGEAEQWLKQARNYHPEQVEPAVLLVEYYERQGDITQAMDLIDATVAIHPQDPRVQLTLARVQWLAGKEREAIATLRKLVELAPDSPKAYILLSMVQMKQQQNEAARNSLEQAVKLEPDSPVARVMLALLDISARDYKTAFAVAQELRKSHPDTVYGDELAGDVYSAQGEYQQAADAYALAYDKEHSALLAKKLFKAHQNNGEHKAARQALTRWLNEEQGDLGARSLLAGSLQSQGKIAEAIEQYLYILERDRDNVSALNNIAWLYQEEGLPDGLKYAERAHELAPDRPEVTDTLGWLLVQNGNFNRGLVLLQEASVKAPHIPEIRYHMAVALAKAGRRDESRMVLDRLLRSGKDFQGVDEARRLRERLGDYGQK